MAAIYIYSTVNNGVNVGCSAMSLDTVKAVSHYTAKDKDYPSSCIWMVPGTYNDAD